MATLSPLTDQQIQAAAEAELAAILSGARAPIEDARKRAAAVALRDAQALQGLGAAHAQILQGVAPGVQAGYNQGAQELSSIAGGFSADMAARVRAAQAANAAEVERLAPGSAPRNVPDPTRLQDVSYGLGGFIPSGSLITQGAAARRHAETLPAISTARTFEAVQGRQGQAREDDAKYEADLLEIARKSPELRQQVMDKLYERELEKMKIRLDERQVRVQERGQTLYEKQFGQKQKEFNFDKWLTTQKLKLEQADQRAAAIKAAKQGRQPDATLSKAYGYIVDSYGEPVLDDAGRRIPVARDTKPKASETNKLYREAVAEARKQRGKPKPNPLYGVKRKGKKSGRYIARPGAAGYSDGTTDNPNRAEREGGIDMTFAEMQSYLMEAYGLSRAKARAALVAAGWKPDGRKPKK